jgi:lipid-A-disaccharide synthase
MKILLLAGEESGMIYRAQIEAALREKNPDVEIRGYGDYGFKTGDLAVMGIIQVLKRIFYFLRVKRTMERAIDEWKPDVVCTVDYPGMNLKLAAYAKARGIKAVHVVCPQVWAWHQSRIPKIEKSVDKICCFLPFEPKIFTPGLAVFVGHPLAVEMERERLSLERAKAQNEGKLLAVLPGSRIGEIRHHMPKLMESIECLQKEMANLKVIIPAANMKAKKAIDAYVQKSSAQAQVRLGFARDVLRDADAAVVASGTATLEAALVNCPTVLVYHVDILFEIICRLILKGVKHIGLINIVCEKTGWDFQYPMPELIQQDFTVGNVVKYLRSWLAHEEANAAARASLAKASRLLMTSDKPIDEIVRVITAK